MVRAGAARRLERRRRRADAQRGRPRRLHRLRGFPGLRCRPIRGRARHHGPDGADSRRFAGRTARARERRCRARLAGAVPQRARRARAQRHRRVARGPGRREGRQRRPARRDAGGLDAHESRAHVADGRQLPAARSANERVGVRSRRGAAVFAREQDATDRRRVARFGAARRPGQERPGHVRRAGACVPVRRRRGRVPRDARDRGRSARIRQRLARGRGPRRQRRVRQRAVLGARQRPRARQPHRRRARRHRRPARRRLHAAGRDDRRPRPGARVPERRAADRELSRRGFRAARSAERHGRGCLRPRDAAAAARSISVDGGPRHHRRRARVPRLRLERDRDQRLARARRRRASRRRHFRPSSSTGR